MNKTLRKAMISTIAMLVVAVMSLTGVTYAWFTQGTEAKVEGMQMSVQAADGGIQVSKDGVNWANLITLTAEDGNIREGVMPVSTVNAENFFKATIDRTNDKKITTVALTPEEYAANIWEEEIWIRNTGSTEITVNLGDTAFVSKDARKVNQAAKLAVFKITEEVDEETQETSESLELLYIFSDENYKGVKEASETSFEYASSGSATQISTPTKLQTSAGDCTITIPAGEVNDAGVLEAIVKIKIVVWVEGQDAQCVNQNAASSFDLNLFFKNANAN